MSQETDETRAPEGAGGDTGPAVGRKLEDLLRQFGRARLELSCDIGQTSMPLRELLALEEGGVVKVSRPVGEDLGLRLNGVRFGRADVMIVDSRVLLRVTEIGCAG